MAADGTYVYWVAEGYAILKISVGGGVPIPVVSLTDASKLVVDANNIYWTYTGLNSVMKAPLDGGASITLASNQYWPQGITVTTANVYWATGGTPPLYVDGTVMAVPIGGGPPTTIASSQHLADGVCVEQQRVYWTDYNGGELNTAPIDGGLASSLASMQSLANDVACDTSSVYWATTGT